MTPTDIDRIEPARYHQWSNAYHTAALAALEPLRKALGYEPRHEVIPDQQHVQLAPLAPWDHRMSAPHGSWLWAISGNSQQPEGYTVQISDLIAERNLFSDAVQLANTTGQGSITTHDATGAPVSIATPLHVLPIPRPAELLNVQLTNKSANPNAVQLVLWIFQPPPQPGARNTWNDELDADIAAWYAEAPGTAAATGDNATASGVTATGAEDPALQLPAYSVSFHASAAGANIIVPGVPGRKIAIHQLSLYNTVQQTIQYTDGPTGADLRGQLLDFAVGGTDNLAYQAEPHFVLNDSNPFIVQLTASIGATGLVTGYVKYRLLQSWTPGQ
jgi:hypothetical protein